MKNRNRYSASEIITSGVNLPIDASPATRQNRGNHHRDGPLHSSTPCAGRWFDSVLTGEEGGRPVKRTKHSGISGKKSGAVAVSSEEGDLDVSDGQSSPATDEATFRALLQQFQAGDKDAGNELWKRYGTELRRSVRARLRNPALRRVVDSLDISHSVARRLCERIHQYEFETFSDFRKLVAVVVKRKVIEVGRGIDRRNEQPLSASANLGSEIADEDDSSPGEQLLTQEIWDRTRLILNKNEWRLFEMVRIDGCSWREVGEQLGESPEALRKRLERALRRVRQELGFEE